MWNNILFLFEIGLLIIQTNAVNMCTIGSTVATDVTLKLLNGTGINGCYCSLKLIYADILGSNKTIITFEVVQFSGCKYRLVVSYYNTIVRFSCNNTDPFYHVINKADAIKLYLEPTSSQDDTTFEMRIRTLVTAIGGPLLRLDCFLPNTDLSTTTSSHSGIQQTSSTVPLSTATSTEDMINSSTKQEDVSDGTVTAGIIGGVIGVVIGGVIGGVLVFIIIYLVKKKRKKKATSEIYSSPSPIQQPESQYTDLQLS